MFFIGRTDVQLKTIVRNLTKNKKNKNFNYKKLAPVLLGEIAVGKGLVVFGVVAGSILIYVNFYDNFMLNNVKKKKCFSSDGRTFSSKL